MTNQDEVGRWNDYRSQGTLHAIDTRVAWALLGLFSVTDDQRYRASARRQLDWTLSQQIPNGWVDYCSFDIGKPPVVHTLAYALEGLLESGVLLSEACYVEAAQKGANALLKELGPTGYLAGAFDRDWKPAANWSCLTGLAQIASVWLRFAEITGDPRYQNGAQRAIQFVAATQRLNGAVSGIQGGISGSLPVYGAYMRFKYPNWAAKFFADAVMNLHTSRESSVK